MASFTVSFKMEDGKPRMVGLCPFSLMAAFISWDDDGVIASSALVSSLVVLQFPSYNKKLKIIQITALPFYDECCYTEKELADVLVPFGFQYTANTMFVLPQVQMVRVRHPVIVP